MTTKNTSGVAGRGRGQGGQRFLEPEEDATKCLSLTVKGATCLSNFQLPLWGRGKRRKTVEFGFLTSFSAPVMRRAFWSGGGGIHHAVNKALPLQERLCKLAEIWVMWHAKELEGIRHQMCQEEFFCSHRLRLRLLHPTPKKGVSFSWQLNVRPFELGKYRCTLNGIAFFASLGR